MCSMHMWWCEALWMIKILHNMQNASTTLEISQATQKQQPNITLIQKHATQNVTNIPQNANSHVRCSQFRRIASACTTQEWHRFPHKLFHAYCVYPYYAVNSVCTKMKRVTEGMLLLASLASINNQQMHDCRLRFNINCIILICI